MTTVGEVLINAAELVDRGWTKGADARNSEGEAINARSKEAVCWCVSGAISCAVWNNIPVEHRAMVAHAARTQLAQVINVFTLDGVENWNDEQFDAAIVSETLREAAEVAH